MFRLISFLTFFALALATPAAAELFNCDGVWTNQPCKSNPAAVISEQPVERAEKPVPISSRRDVWLYDLEYLSLTARRQYKVRIDIGDIKEICRSANTTDEECRNKVLEREKVINERIKLALEIEKARATPEARVPQQQTQPSVVIIERQTDNYYLLYRRTPAVPRRRPTAAVDPNTLIGRSKKKRSN